MSREVRRVPATWKHPNNQFGNPKPLYDGSYAEEAAKWDEENAQWAKGLRRSFEDESKWVPTERDSTFTEWSGSRPEAADYMPDWPAAERTHLQMYETVTEGTPISPVMATAEELARWLTNTGASAFGPTTATYDQWLAMIREGSSVGSAVLSRGELISGVAAVSKGGK